MSERRGRDWQLERGINRKTSKRTILSWLSFLGVEKKLSEEKVLKVQGETPNQSSREKNRKAAKTSL